MLKLKPPWALGIFVIFDTICVGMGMGVPIFNILFGFVVGWYVIGMLAPVARDTRGVLEQALRYAAVTAGITFIAMAILWGRCLAMLFDSRVDLAKFGIPMILYEAKASFIGWLVLMIVISPFLQFLTTVFGLYVALLFRLRRSTYAH
jgi:hypothetical protein